MDINWIEIIKAVVLILFGGAVVYFKNSPKLQDEALEFQEEIEGWLEYLRGEAVEFIDQAEREFEGTKRGGEKRKWVVDKLHDLLPDGLKPFVSKGLIETIVQNTFDFVEDYAKLQLDKITDKIIKSDSKEGA